MSKLSTLRKAIDLAEELGNCLKVFNMEDDIESVKDRLERLLRNVERDELKAAREQAALQLEKWTHPTEHLEK